MGSEQALCVATYEIFRLLLRRRLLSGATLTEALTPSLVTERWATVVLSADQTSPRDGEVDIYVNPTGVWLEQPTCELLDEFFNLDLGIAGLLNPLLPSTYFTRRATSFH